MLRTTDDTVNLKLRMITALALPQRVAALASQPLARAPQRVIVSPACWGRARTRFHAFNALPRAGRTRARIHAFNAFPRVHSLSHPISTANHDHVASRSPIKDQATCRPPSLRRDPSRNEATGQLFTSNAFLAKSTSTLAPMAALVTVQLVRACSPLGGRKSDGIIDKKSAPSC